MGKTILVSDRVNSFFTNNKIQAGTEIPTSGSYIKGDIIVNIGPTSASEPMWVCTEDGNPGTWGLVGVGGGSLVSINESIVIDTAASEVSLGSLAGVVSPKDKLLVHYNSAYLMEGIDYEISADATKIIKLGGGTWNSNNDPDSIFTFELLKSVESVDGVNIKIDSKLTSVTNNVVVTSPVTEVEIGIEGYNASNDMLMVFKNSTFIVEGVDYTVDGNKIISTGETWNSGSSANYSFAFVVFKEVAIINPEAIVGTDDIVNGSVTMDKLSGDVKQAIEDASNIDLSGYQEKIDNGLVTTDKTIVGAINELFQNANNGKELIATAIGEPLTAEDTFSAMSNGIDGLTSSFKTALMNNGVTVESADKFKSLIEKLALLADSEGKGIQYASGEIQVSAENLKTLYYTNGGRQFVCIKCECSFRPSILVVYSSAYTGTTGNPTNTNIEIKGIYENVSMKNTSPSYTLYYNNTHTNINNERYYEFNTTTSNFTKEFEYSNGIITLPLSLYNSINTYPICKWYAIGVGEEDTTLEDSLRSILTSKDISVTEEDDLASLISKVDLIPLAQGDAVEANVLSGKTFTNADGSLRTGTMANNGSKTFTPAKATQTGSAGYYNGITVKGDSNLVAANIISGKSIFGINGSATVNSLGGKNFATGTLTASELTTGEGYTYYNETTTRSAKEIKVTNLSFTPSFVIAYSKKYATSGTDDQPVTVVTVQVDDFICIEGFVGKYNATWTTKTAYSCYYKKITVTNGFRIPFNFSSNATTNVITWIAIG